MDNREGWPANDHAHTHNIIRFNKLTKFFYSISRFYNKNSLLIKKRLHSILNLIPTNAVDTYSKLLKR
jgi:hypothetical protein